MEVVALPPVRVLVVDDEQAQRQNLASMITSWGYQVETAADGQMALDQLMIEPPAVVVTDLMMPRMDGLELLREIAARCLTVPSIILTAFGSIETAVQAIAGLGAFWFLEKPVQPALLRMLIERAAGQWRLEQEKLRLKRQLALTGSIGEMVGTSPGMRQVFAAVEQVASSPAVVMITGETGVGKELTARLIHRLSPRCGGPFVAVDGASLPESLAESEIFGHEKGAFAGALERRAGCFELADRGTLFLDKITELPLGTQAKLLRVLEDHRVRRMGGRKEIAVDVRVLASSSQAPEEALRAGLLRDDLYYRVSVFTIAIPPLRDRMEDIPLLAESVLKDLNETTGARIIGLEPAALALLGTHTWPGNVRELRNVLQRAALIRGDGWITKDEVQVALSPSAVPAHHAGTAAQRVLLPIGSTVEMAERTLIDATLRHTRNNRTRAAAILGMSLKSLFNKLKTYEAAAGNQKSEESGGKVFVAMPFGPKFDPIFEDHICRVVATHGMRSERADSFRTPGAVIDDILAGIAGADAVIADCSTANANVFYEVGIAHAIGKPTILITSDLNAVPFDLKHLRIIVYEFTPRGMKQFEEELGHALASINSGLTSLSAPTA
jgi:DNA-binding NtrC family response regulator